MNPGGLRRIVEIVKVMSASRGTWRTLHQRVRGLLREDKPAMFYEARELVRVDASLQPFFERFGRRVFVVLGHRPLFLPREEHAALKRDFARVRRNVKIGSIDVTDRLLLDGGGSGHAKVFVDYLRSRFPGRVFEHALEWCSGPGYIAFGLLDAGICRRASLLDLNPDALECVERTVAANDLRDRVTGYLSNNFAAIEAAEQFDLIVGNPPWSHSTIGGHNELIASDPGWQIHRDFYSAAAGFVRPGGVLCISEYEPFETRALLEGVWDVRPRLPNDDFVEMIRDGGLTHLETILPAGAAGSTPHGHGMWFVVSTKEPVRPA